MRKMYFCPYETMVKVPCSVISESWEISKFLLVTITNVTYNESSLCLDLVHCLKFERNLS